LDRKNFEKPFRIGLFYRRHSAAAGVNTTHFVVLINCNMAITALRNWKREPLAGAPAEKVIHVSKTYVDRCGVVRHFPVLPALTHTVIKVQPPARVCNRTPPARNHMPLCIISIARSHRPAASASPSHVKVRRAFHCAQSAGGRHSFSVLWVILFCTVILFPAFRNFAFLGGFYV
jgi:hypothetical protein